jgi:hypothetical protein
MLQEYAGPRCRLLRNEKNQGLFPTLNRLMAEARSRWVHLWSQDDRMLPQCLRRTWEFALEHPQVGMIYSRVRRIDESGRAEREPPPDLTPEVVTPLVAARIMFYFGSIAGNIANVTLRKDAFDRLGGFDESLKVSGDYEYWTRVSELLPIGFQREFLVDLRAHGGQFSRQLQSGTDFIRENREIHDRLFSRLTPDERAHAQRYRRWFVQVKHFHHAVRCALDGEFGASADVLKLLRAETALSSLTARWLLSGNGRLVPMPAIKSD